MTEGRQPTTGRAVRPGDPNHVQSTVEEIAAEPFLNADHYLKANDIQPRHNEVTGLEVWELDGGRGGD